MEERERYRLSERAAALDVILDNLPTAGHPTRGDAGTLERAREVFDALRPEPDQEGR
ncbi:hypothetical protein [Thermomonospora cellulosilytica]|uniref:Uncharacterized protein n=1 Tax=Thermomonospora cellulosilytica TaxID=1411118 RepID=A0A7W3R8W0_9ACTN|nr:hypothetical protein [Thermomonospora cellulosilytica]MBA9003720.1 hypothetical protein [Thermomonospora cellulosilytica]